MALITLQPESGLDRVATTVAYDFAKRLAKYNRSGVPDSIAKHYGDKGDGQDIPARRGTFKNKPSP